MMPPRSWLPTKHDRLADAHRAYSDNGWRPFPVGTGPDKKNKKPLVKWTETPPFPRCDIPAGATGLGIPTGGAERLVVLDVDGDNGRASLALLEVEHGPLPPTLTSRTGRADGGEHRVFRCPDELELPRCSASKIGPGLDVRGEGGYIVVAPSLHELGTRYEWIDRREAAVLPTWLHELMTRPAKAPSPPPIQQTLPTRPRQAAARQATTTQAERRRDAWRSKALEGAARRVREAPEGQRNHTLNVAALGLGHYVPTGWIDESEARAVLHRAALDVGLAEPETVATIESGMMAGKRDPKEPADRARPGPAKVRDAAAPSGDAALDALIGRLTRNAYGAVAASPANVADIIRLHPKWAGVLGFDARCSKAVFRSRPPFRFWDESAVFPVPVADHHAGALMEWLARDFEEPFTTNKATVIDAFDWIGREASFDPLVEHLRGLKWDGVLRLDSVLVDYAGSADTPFNRAAFRKWMISGVARAMQPGCKADQVIVFEGPERTGKSTALEVLAGKDINPSWHADQLPNLENKDSMIHLQGPWILEVAELATAKKARAEQLKAFITSRVDRFRRPHGVIAEDFPRRCILAATTNESQYLEGSTGNRRFWPVRTRKWNIKKLREDRDQIVAEAVAMFDEGEAWHLDETLEEAAKVAATECTVLDTWTERVEAFLEDKDEVTAVECLDHIGQRPEHQKTADEKRIIGILRNAGWRPTGTQGRRDGRRSRVWARPRTDLDEPVQVVELVRVVEPVQVAEQDDDFETVAAMADDLARTRTATGIGLWSPTASDIKAAG